MEASTQMNRMILIILDGLRFDLAQSSMGYLSHLVETNQASLHRVIAELPTLSRPLYETLLTGTSVSVHGITCNAVNRLSNQVSIFHRVVQQGGITAAAAYSWFSELYNDAPFSPFLHREQHRPQGPIQHGLFYFSDDYPDSHVFADAEYLRQTYAPQFLLVHPMGLDYVGHQFGAPSQAYEAKTIAMDGLLAQYLPLWLQAGYGIVITADHGMNSHGLHGGDRPEWRDVPLFCLGSSALALKPLSDPVSQLAIAPLVCSALGVALD